MYLEKLAVTEPRALKTGGSGAVPIRRAEGLETHARLIEIVAQDRATNHPLSLKAAPAIERIGARVPRRTSKESGMYRCRGHGTEISHGTCAGWGREWEGLRRGDTSETSFQWGAIMATSKGGKDIYISCGAAG